jgi:crotonobetainyl-CoA:carnitine CoA-transferase CaiB-like acyl-CoA transferase
MRIDLHDKYRPSLQNRESAMRPLEGLFVLDFSTLLPGPLATLLLAEAGAEVIKIEPPRGEEMRGRAPKWGRDSAGFALLNRGKRSIVLDLKNADERARLQPLVKRADVIVEQFRPGVMERLGLDYDSVTKLNPTVVYCSISGYGQTGPKRGVAAHDLNYISDAGLLALSMGDLSRPVLPPTLIADIAGGAYPAVVNILLALEERRRSGRGRHLDVAMAENLFPLMFWAIGQGLVAGTFPGNGAGYVTGGSARYGLYPTKDGRVLAAAPLEQKFWETFCDLIGLEGEFRDDGKNPAATKARIAAIVATETADVWRSRFAGKDCCCSIVASLGDALTDPHYVARGVFRHVLTNPEGAAMPALPMPLDPAFRAAPAAAIASPALGADNETYLA